MTTQQDRAELIRWLELEAMPHRPGSHSRQMLLKAAAMLAADARGGEAVGWTTSFDLEGATSGFTKTLVCRPMSVQPSFPEHQVIYIYTHPERVPLTDEQIRAIWVEHGCDGEDAEGFARAIESAHHIGKPEPVGPLEDEHGVVAGK